MGMTKLGLPLLREETYAGYIKKLDQLKSPERAKDFFEEALSEIRKHDSLKARFIEGASAMYPVNDRDVALAEITSGFLLLGLEGKLPKLDEKKFKEQWDVTMNRAVAILNVGANMDIIFEDNPVYGRFIMKSTQYFPREEGMNVMSDHSCGYMFLVRSRI
ncbi:hypothetical protein HY450_02420 [Candidatus Pacearchaeota archaeon]|nr:hypothetical protein [Candidatus Pacearchaeota archaeon]